MTDYRANNTAHSREAADTAYETLRAAEQHAVTSQAAANAAADALTAARRDFHGIVLGIKNEARALYGPSSDQVAALGLKKKSEQTKRVRVKKEVAGE
jgi:predicted aminopeptidase